MQTKYFPENIYGPNGIGETGSTVQTIFLARYLQKYPAGREAIRNLLNALECEYTYSNEDFDRRQRVAATLADIIRAEARA